MIVTRLLLSSIAITLLLGAGARPAQAAATQDHASIRSAAEQFARAQAGVLAPAGAELTAHAATLDPRLALRACAEPLTAFTPPGFRPAARVSIGVRCPTSDGWTLYVPVRVEIATEVVVLAAPASRGDVLRHEQLAIERRDVAPLLDGYLTRLDDAQNMVLRRNVPVGAVLTAAVLSRPTLVRRGQRVVVLSRSGSFTVRSEAEALSDGAAGERIRARNLRSRQVIEGVVDEQGRLEVGRTG